MLPNEDGVVLSGRETPEQPQLYFIGFNDLAGRLAEMNKESAAILADLRAKSYI